MIKKTLLVFALLLSIFVSVYAHRFAEHKPVELAQKVKPVVVQKISRPVAIKRKHIIAHKIHKAVVHYAYTYKVRGHYYHVLTKASAKSYKKQGQASWYGPGFQGRKAADGGRYSMYAMTAASKVLPLDSKVRVTNLHNHRSVVVKITDRGPFIAKRVIDMSYLAAKKLGYAKKGFTQVEVVTLM